MDVCRGASLALAQGSDGAQEDGEGSYEEVLEVDAEDHAEGDAGQDT